MRPHRIALLTLLTLAAPIPPARAATLHVPADYPSIHTPFESARGAGTDLIVNGDFESGNVGFTTQYTYSHGNIYLEGKYDVAYNPCDSHPWCTCFLDHTTGAGLMLVVNGATVPDRVAWSEVVPVSQSTRYTLSLWLANWSIEQNFNLSPLDILINDTVVATFNNTANGGAWLFRQAAWDSGPANEATIKIIDRNLGYGGNDFALDDISFVPEGTVSVEASTWSGVKAMYR